MPHWQAKSLSIRKNASLTSILLVNYRKNSHWQAKSLSKTKLNGWGCVLLTSKKLVRLSKKTKLNGCSWLEPCTSDKQKACQCLQNYIENRQTYTKFITDKQKACQCNDCRTFFSSTDKLFACQWIEKQKNTSLTSKKLVSSRQKQKAEGKRLLERRPLDLREHLNGDI